jgi:hypothetical protein
MKRWSLLSIPLVGLASITVWAQAVTGAPTGQEPGVIVREPDPHDSVLNIDGFTENPRLSPLTNPAATPRASSPELKSARLDPATPSPRSTKAAVPSSEDPGVELVEPGHVTSPAVEPGDDSTSSSSTSSNSTSSGQPDGKSGLNSGLSGTSGRSGSSNE